MPKQSLLVQCALAVLFSLMLLWTVPASASHHAEAAADEIRNVYVCGCGPACGCGLVSDQPGNCPCGKPMIEKQVVREDADKVYVCACAEGCKCAPSQADPSKCSCGKELQAYPKHTQRGCAHGMPAGCDKPCCQKAPADAK